MKPAPLSPPSLDDAPSAGHDVLVQPLGRHFPAPAGQTLLASALAAGVVLPSSCRNGTCRACMCVATKGAVAYRIEWPGLSAEEKQAGHILPCVALPLTDLVLQVPGARGD